VALAEEGWTGGEVAIATARRYLAPLFARANASPDVLVLGCTHFPPLAVVIREVAGDAVRIVDSAVTTAGALAQVLATRGVVAQAGVAGSVHFLVTDIERVDL
jgi:glutamate racemase